MDKFKDNNSYKNTPLMTFIKVMFGVFVVAVFAYFIYGETVLPADSPSNGDYEYKEYDGEWTWTKSDGTTETFKFPYQCDAERGEIVTIETILPDVIENNSYLCFRSTKQDMKIWIDGELRRSYSTEDTRAFGTNSAVAYIFIELLPTDAGKALTMETISDSSFSGVFYSAYYGDRMSIWYRFVPRYLPELMIAFLELVLSVITIIVSNILRIKYNRRVELAYLGWSVFLGACWSIFNSEFRQLLFPSLSTVSDMAFFMIMLIPFPFLIYMNEIQEYRYRKPYIFAGFVIVIDFIVCSTLHIAHIVDFTDTFIAMAGSCFLAIFMIAVTVIIDFIKKRAKDYRLVVIGILGAFFAASIQIVKYFIKSSQFSGTTMALGLIFLLTTATINTIHNVLHIEKEKQKAIMESEAKARFLANMSHEIRTPINAILGMDAMILRESEETSTKEYALDIQHAGENLLSLINDVLDMSKIEAGKMEIIPVDYDFSSVIHDIVSMISIKAADKGLDIQVLVDRELPSRLYGDEIRIRQILLNLLNNAVKYTEKGSVTLKIDGEVKVDKASLTFTVSDTGIGIKEEDISKLFSEFERIEERRNRNIEGTGLGMNITLTLLEMMGSKLNVESIYGEGTTFSFDLEQGVINAEPIGDIEERIRKQSQEYKYDVSFVAPDAHVLVVDDNMINRRVFRGLLKETKVNVDEAESGMECLEMVTKKHYDIIFLDHMMPEMDGVETLAHMKEMPDNMCKDTPVIALTANAISGAREMYLAEGFDEFLSKPIVPDKLEKLVSAYLPKEKVLEAPVKNTNDENKKSDGEKQNKSDTIMSSDSLPDIEGIDWQYALAHMPDMDILLDTVNSFYISMDSEADYLENCYNQLFEMYDNYDTDNEVSNMDLEKIVDEPTDDTAEERNEVLSLYRTKVHAMKSSAAMIGAVELSDKAKLLEYAARDKRVFRVLAVTSDFLKEWREYKDKLKCMIKEEPLDKLTYNYEDVNIYLKMLLNFMENMELDSSDETMAKLREYDYPDDVADDIQELSVAVENIDYDMAGEIIESLLDKLPK
ncbi:MAG: response regulator [Lachnospiraceae bacterium]|nr:response regulator [Lachnospiraceae bacterium]